MMVHSGRPQVDQKGHSYMLLVLTVLSKVADGSTREDDRGSESCIHWHRPGKVLFYRDTAVLPIGISVPGALVQKRVPRKYTNLAKFMGSSAGGNMTEYRFDAMEERKYHAWYAYHRFAITHKKGGWDALRHVEILALGSVPVFMGLRGASDFVVPFLPRRQLLDAEDRFSPFEPWFRDDEHCESRDAAYNASVNSLLTHTRRCLTAEAMAAYVLRALGLWPSKRPLSLLYVTCGFGWTDTLSDGWQGPVSIGLFIGLQLLLRRLPGSRVIDAPSMEAAPDIWPQEGNERLSYFWYVFRRRQGCKYRERELRTRMYGFGFSYAFVLPRELLATEEERQRVPDALNLREFDAVIFGKVGPAQGCEPLPFLDNVLSAGYPPQRIAFIYGGDFGLETSQVSGHARQYAGIGLTFFREMDAANAFFSWKSDAMLPRACYLDYTWRSFFKLWKMRLACWGCGDIDDAFESIWQSLLANIQRVLEALVIPPQTSLREEGLSNGLRKGDLLPREIATQSCWTGAMLAFFPLLGHAASRRDVEQRNRCGLAELTLKYFAKRVFLISSSRSGHRYIVWLLDQMRWRRRRQRYAIEFFDEFGVFPGEALAFVCDTCLRLPHSPQLTTICRSRRWRRSVQFPFFRTNYVAGQGRLSLSTLRDQAKMQIINISSLLHEQGRARTSARRQESYATTIPLV